MQSHKPYSSACERNRDPILSVLRAYFADRRRVLEIGSGTGQHAVYFAGALTHLIWQAADVADNLPSMQLWLDEANLANTPKPLMLDVEGDWPDTTFDAIFSANTLHIMSWSQVECAFSGIDRVLDLNGVVAIYGPFNYNNQFTSESNAAFDASLRSRAAHMGIRDFEAVNHLAQDIGLQLIADIAMPANNRTLVWRRNSVE